MSAAAIIWMLLAAAILLAYIRGGPSGISSWLKAKFIGTGA